MPIEDPCLVLAELEAAYRALVMGRAAKRVRYRDDTGAEQEVDHHRTSLVDLRAEVLRYRGLCDASLGLQTAPNQFCVRAG